MELIVYWTQFAEDKLSDIFEYYKFYAGFKVAKDLTDGIVDASFEIEKNPYGYQREELLKDRVQEYRYAVFKNYKIIFWIDEVNKMILVSHVFDTRRNPKKLSL